MLENCAKSIKKKRKLIRNTNVMLDQEIVIRELEQTRTGKYVDINKLDRIQ